MNNLQELIGPFIRDVCSVAHMSKSEVKSRLKEITDEAMFKGAEDKFQKISSKVIKQHIEAERGLIRKEEREGPNEPEQKPSERILEIQNELIKELKEYPEDRAFPMNAIQITAIIKYLDEQ